MIITLTNKTIRLRPIQDEDLMVLSQIYGSTREKELAQVVAWNDQQKKAFIQQQFMAQHTYYQKNYVGAAFYIIEQNNHTIGRLYIQKDFQDSEIRIIDIALLPQWQNKGIGKCILEDILAEASNLNKAVSIHVETFNPAMNLYKQLGFEKISETNGVYHLLEWKHKQ